MLARGWAAVARLAVCRLPPRAAPGRRLSAWAGAAPRRWAAPAGVRTSAAWVALGAGPIGWRGFASAAGGQEHDGSAAARAGALGHRVKAMRLQELAGHLEQLLPRGTAEVAARNAQQLRELTEQRVAYVQSARERVFAPADARNERPDMAALWQFRADADAELAALLTEAHELRERRKVEIESAGAVAAETQRAIDELAYRAELWLEREDAMACMHEGSKEWTMETSRTPLDGGISSYTEDKEKALDVMLYEEEMHSFDVAELGRIEQLLAMPMWHRTPKAAQQIARYVHEYRPHVTHQAWDRLHKSQERHHVRNQLWELGAGLDRTLPTSARLQGERAMAKDLRGSLSSDVQLSDMVEAGRAARENLYGAEREAGRFKAHPDHLQLQPGLAERRFDNQGLRISDSYPHAVESRRSGYTRADDKCSVELADQQAERNVWGAGGADRLAEAAADEDFMDGDMSELEGSDFEGLTKSIDHSESREALADISCGDLGPDGWVDQNRLDFEEALAELQAKKSNAQRSQRAEDMPLSGRGSQRGKVVRSYADMDRPSLLNNSPPGSGASASDGPEDVDDALERRIRKKFHIGDNDLLERLEAKPFQRALFRFFHMYLRPGDSAYGWVPDLALHPEGTSVPERNRLVRGPRRDEDDPQAEGDAAELDDGARSAEEVHTDGDGALAGADESIAGEMASDELESLMMSRVLDPDDAVVVRDAEAATAEAVRFTFNAADHSDASELEDADDREVQSMMRYDEIDSDEEMEKYAKPFWKRPAEESGDEGERLMKHPGVKHYYPTDLAAPKTAVAATGNERAGSWYEWRDGEWPPEAPVRRYHWSDRKAFPDGYTVVRMMCEDPELGRYAIVHWSERWLVVGEVSRLNVPGVGTSLFQMFQIPPDHLEEMKSVLWPRPDFSLWPEVQDKLPQSDVPPRPPLVTPQMVMNSVRHYSLY